MNAFPEIILASASPRRAALLQQIGVRFRVATHNVDETKNVPLDPKSHVLVLAQRKATAVAADFPDQIVVGSDTIVVRDGHILGKPADREDAKSTLRSLSGRSHTVLTGIAIARGAETVTQAEQTTVFFRELSDTDINWYVNTGEPMDKAGSYGIQGFGALLVERIEGCYFNVMGFPLVRFHRMMQRVLGSSIDS